MKNNTIAAIATSLGDSGIGIIRISGPDAISIADKVYISYNNKNNNKNNNKSTDMSDGSCNKNDSDVIKASSKGLSDYESHTIHHGYIIDRSVSENEIIDEVMVSVMKAPNTYTREDVVEINCHGGVLVVNKTLELLISNGCRLAEPGEFTKRAFLNGRIDLSEAEAVMDLIHSKNEFALKSSLKQLNGAVCDKVKSLREKILHEIAFIESAIDDPEHISLDGYRDELRTKVSEIADEIKGLIDNADNGKILKDGINTVIVGKPNAGKSSLLNLILGEDKAIVTSIAGTTRDIIEESVKLNGIGLNIVDTAGIRDTDNEIEKLGVEKAIQCANDADLIIYVIDSSVPLDRNDIDIIRLICHKKVIVLLNKTDLEACVDEKQIYNMFNKYYFGNMLSDSQEEIVTESFDTNILTDVSFNSVVDNLVKNLVDNNDVSDLSLKLLKIIKTSTKKNIGIDEFENTIRELFFDGSISLNEELYITNLRHKEAFSDAFESLNQVLVSLSKDMPEDFYSIDLMSAYSHLGRIIGEEVDDDLVNEIFSKFCMGK